MKKTDNSIIFCVTNDLVSDQRIFKIASSLFDRGYRVFLYGRLKTDSLPFDEKKIPFKRVRHWINKGVFFYFEYQMRLLWHLLFNRFDILYAADFDTLPATRTAQLINKCILIFDSHEAFPEVPELQNKAIKKKFWEWIGKTFTFPSMPCITVSNSIKVYLKENYSLDPIVILNLPEKQEFYNIDDIGFPIKLVYQGKLNKGRGLEILLEVIPDFNNIELHIIGEGDLDLKSDASNVFFHGFISPLELHRETLKYDVGLNLLDPSSLNYRWSLANKYFDYIQAGLPVITMDFPEYRKLEDQFQLSYLINSIEKQELISVLIKLKKDLKLLKVKKQNTLQARESYFWGREEAKLYSFIDRL